jgi:hypothetical protein
MTWKLLCVQAVNCRIGQVCVGDSGPSLRINFITVLGLQRLLSFSGKKSGLLIEAKPDEMYDGLFGQVLLWVFQILPVLYERQIFPDWRIHAAYYGRASDGLVIPGVLELAYNVEPGLRKEVNLIRLRGHRHILGNDWQALSTIWHAYFRIPDRIIKRALDFGSLSNTLGVHYRGNDKQTAHWDTNPVSHDDYLSIIRQFCQERPEFQRIFLATDDANFYEFLKRQIALEVINLGDVGFHKDRTSPELADARTDRAMLDCVTLSRCGAVLLTSSALPSFAKVLNPKLEIYRVAASKLFEKNVPYFPVAYVPIYNSSSPEIANLLDRLMVGDWTKSSESSRFTESFVSRPFLSPVLRAIYSIYFHVRRLPGFNWLAQLPKLMEEAYRRKQQDRL